LESRKIKLKKAINRNINDKNEIKNKEMDEIIDRALKIANPTLGDKKELEHINNEIIERIKKSQYYKHIVKIITVGSFAKDTFLKNDADIDIFIVLENSINNKTFEEITLNIGFLVLEDYCPRTRYSEHPYVEGFVPLPPRKNKANEEKSPDRVKINIVPCYDVKEGEWKSSADRSPFHTKYMIEKLDGVKKEQVRLLKLFFKAINVYGAELSIAGFSGYVAEVLIVKYGTFLSVLHEMANNKEEHKIILIDDNNNTIDKEKLISRFSDSSIIIIDPIDSKRNLGTAISHESLSRFILEARNFLKNPSLTYFKIKEKDSDKAIKNIEKKIDRLRKTNAELLHQVFENLLFIQFEHEQMVPDVIWGQILKLERSIEKQLKFYGFNVLKSECTTNENEITICVFLLETINLSQLITREGPSIFMKENLEKFLETSNKKAIVTWTTKEMKINCVIEREFTNASKLLTHLLNEKINEIGISKGLRKNVQESFKINDGNKIYNIINKKNIKSLDYFNLYVQLIDDILQ